jgi:ribosome-binding factor A
MQYSRVDRLQSQMIKELARVVEEDLKDRPPYMITFTRTEIGACISFLKRHAGVIKKIIGSKMRIKHMPAITYVYDDTGENVARIGEILNRLKDERNE